MAYRYSFNSLRAPRLQRLDGVPRTDVKNVNCPVVAPSDDGRALLHEIGRCAAMGPSTTAAPISVQPLDFIGKLVGGMTDISVEFLLVSCCCGIYI